jgi:hypothetical protein
MFGDAIPASPFGHIRVELGEIKTLKLKSKLTNYMYEY